uniref:RING-type domain-containing protein n=1 Tax=Meloidogyne enterolobii TaxID=390850 RepID=A0A6V7WNT0_MELEN|nr:unnamed protein product [Meloidogyne enterolobii]
MNFLFNFLEFIMVYYKFGRCTVCQFRLRSDNVYTLKNCNHTFHHDCVTRWINEVSQDCPRCRVAATLTDIKQLFVEEKTNDFFHKKSSDLAIVKLTDSMSCKYANFVEIKNKWTKIYGKCCDNKCINTTKPNGNCIKGNGYGNIINDENIKYFVRLEGKGDGNTHFQIYAENSFNKPQNCVNYTVYYFEIKCKFEREAKNLLNLSTTFNNNDIFGCGLVYPPTNKLEKKEEFPYVFFTHNGKKLGKGTLLKDNFDSFNPFVDLLCCSAETNFGNDLELKPFIHDISKHLVLQEFY